MFKENIFLEVQLFDKKRLAVQKYLGICININNNFVEAQLFYDEKKREQKKNEE